MKSAMPWVLVVALLGATWFLYVANKEKEAELGRLSPASQEMEKLRAEIADLKKSPGQNSDAAKANKDSDELIRLRGEIQRLRDQNKQLGDQLAAARKAQGAEASLAQQQMERLRAENEAIRKQAPPDQPAAGSPQQQLDACVANLRQLDAAKQQWALENKKTIDATPTAADLAPYLPKDNPLTCPAGGAYTLNSMQEPPVCSVPGHKIP